MSVPHPGLVATVIVVLSLPAILWIVGWISRALARYDARADARERELITASLGPDDTDIDTLVLIEVLAQEEIELIREVLDRRFGGDHVTPEEASELRWAHRQGLAVRQRCGDSVLDAELGWLQGYGSYALMADLSDLNRAEFDRDLDHRAAELRRTIDLRRSHSPHVSAVSNGAMPR